MQQGANSATIPAKKAEINDTDTKTLGSTAPASHTPQLRHVSNFLSYLCISSRGTIIPGQQQLRVNLSPSCSMLLEIICQVDISLSKPERIKFQHSIINLIITFSLAYHHFHNSQGKGDDEIYDTVLKFNSF